MRRLRIPAPAQLSLTPSQEDGRGEELWSSLPEEAKAAALAALARLIAGGAIGEDEENEKGATR